MLREFEQILDEQMIGHPDIHILLAVSGGVDSVVLFHLMQAIDEEKRPRLSIAHINHQLRDESTRDEAFVRNLAVSQQIPFYSYTWKKEEHPESGVEEAARTVRYNFFKELMDKHEASVLMTAHHQDDQVETVLMKLARGSSLEQLTGIQLIQPFHYGQLMRPLLSFSKKQLVEYAQKHQLDYVEDATNDSLAYTRNRYRNQIIPLIKKENAQFNEHIEQLTKDIQDVLEISRQPINEQYKSLVREVGEALIFDYSLFFQLEEPMQRALLREVFRKLYKNAEVSYKTAYIEMVRSWLKEGAVNTTLDLLHQFTARKDYQNVIFEKKAKKTASHADDTYTLEKNNQWVKLSEKEKVGVFEYKGEEESEEMLIFHADQVKLPLTIRHRRPGDRMSYKGLSGTKKIKDIFIDEKVSPQKRDSAWIVEDADGQIIWLISYRKMYLLSAEETDKIAYVIKYETNESINNYKE